MGPGCSSTSFDGFQRVDGLVAVRRQLPQDDSGEEEMEMSDSDSDTDVIYESVDSD